MYSIMSSPFCIYTFKLTAQRYGLLYLRLIFRKTILSIPKPHPSNLWGRGQGARGEEQIGLSGEDMGGDGNKM
jgi:hypothetical protein